MSLASDRFGSVPSGARFRSRALPLYHGLPAMMAQYKHVLGFADARSEARHSTMVWMQLLRRLALGPRDLVGYRALLGVQNFISLILGNRRRAEACGRTADASAARVVLSLSCTTRSGKPAVEICF